MLTLLAFVLPLGLDGFAVAAALGALSPSRRERWRVTAVFVAFEGGMPLIGLGLGAPMAHAVSGIAEWIAAAVLIGVGAWMLVSGDGDDEEERVRQLSKTRGLAVIGLGIGISLDELAIGFSLGLTHLPTVAAVIAIVVQAVVAVQLGLNLGARVGERARENVERLAAVVLIVLGVTLAVTHLLKMP